MQLYRAHVLVCGGTGCTSSNSNKIITELEEQIARNGIQNEVKVVRTGCFGLCAEGRLWWFILKVQCIQWSKLKM